MSTEYKYGFVTPIESEVFPKGLSENTIRQISAKKQEPDFMLQFRLKAFRKWEQMEEPKWPNVKIPPQSTIKRSLTTQSRRASQGLNL